MVAARKLVLPEGEGMAQMRRQIARYIACHPEVDTSRQLAFLLRDLEAAQLHLRKAHFVQLGGVVRGVGAQLGALGLCHAQGVALALGAEAAARRGVETAALLERLLRLLRQAVLAAAELESTRIF